MLYVDFETRSNADLRAVGAYNYACHESTEIMIVTWAEDEGPVKAWWPDKFGRCSQPLQELQEVAKTDTYVIAFNSFFDRHIWDMVGPDIKLPRIPSNRWLCARVLAEASCLPGSLKKAAKVAGSKKLDEDGRLIKKFTQDLEWTDDKAKSFTKFVEYARQDIEALRDVVAYVRPLNHLEWGQFHENETVNDTGLPINMQFVRAAQAFAEFEKIDLNNSVAELTGGKVTSIYQHTRKPKYVEELLEGDTGHIADSIRKAMVIEKDGEMKKSFGKEVRQHLLELLTTLPDELIPPNINTILAFTELCDESGTASTKYKKIASLTGEDSRLRGAYVFCGAGQTGRYSSRGAQTHNLVRFVLDNDEEEILRVQENMIIASRKPEDVADEARLLKEEYGMGMQKILGRLIRSSITAPEGYKIVSVDLKQGEPRVCAWLAGADHILNLFGQNVDFYTLISNRLFNVEKCTKEQRQLGKILHLSCMFGGGKNSFIRVGKNYGLDISEAKAYEYVRQWRTSNPWAVNLYTSMMKAAINAVSTPMVEFPAGKVAYMYIPGLAEGTLTCKLPSGRYLMYRRAKLEERNWPDGTPFTSISYEKSKGFRNDLWPGICIENATQAAQNDILRHLISKSLSQGHRVVGHTHDEIIYETPSNRVDEDVEELLKLFRTSEDWFSDIPLEGDVTVAPFYHK